MEIVVESALKRKLMEQEADERHYKSGVIKEIMEG